VDGTRSGKSAFLTSVSYTEGTKLIAQSALVDRTDALNAKLELCSMESGVAISTP